MWDPTSCTCPRQAWAWHPGEATGRLERDVRDGILGGVRYRRSVEIENVFFDRS